MQRLSARRPFLWRLVIFSLCASGLTVAHATPAQSSVVANQQSSTTTFTASSDLVLVPVVVLHGKQHVAGLTKDDFVVLEDKVAQRIAFVNPTPGGTELKRVGSRNVFTSQLQGQTEPPRLTIIAVDSMNTALAHQPWVAHEVKDVRRQRPRNARANGDHRVHP